MWIAALALFRPSIVARPGSDQGAPDSSLIARAKKVANAADWETHSYVWRTNTSVVANVGDSDRPRFVVIDLPAKTTRSLDGLNREIALRSPGYVLDWTTFSRKSDMLLLKAADGFKGPAQEWIAVSLDGKRWVHARTTPFPMGHAAWLPDGRHWIEIIGQTGSAVVVHDIVAPENLSITDLDIGPRDPSRAMLLALLGLIANGRMVAVVNSDAEGTTLLEIGIEARGQSPVFHHITVPDNGAVVHIIVSPRGDRLAWQCYKRNQHTKQGPSGDQAASQLGVTQVFTSELDGRNLRLLGLLPGVEVDGLQWTPDGKQVSFVYKRALYVVPAP